jgi:metal-dependent amidase/aminoacylase/carboxypeptidase family protein
VIPDEAKIGGNIRIFDQTSYKKVLENMKKIVENVVNKI